MLVGEIAVRPAAVGPRRRGRPPGSWPSDPPGSRLDLRVEEKRDHLLADRAVQLEEHRCAPRCGTRRAGPSAPCRGGGCPRACSPCSRGARASGGRRPGARMYRSRSRIRPSWSASISVSRSRVGVGASSRNSSTIASRSSPCSSSAVDAGAVERLHRRDEPVEIPVLAQLAHGVLGDEVRDHLRQPLLLISSERSAPSSTRRRCS